VQREALGAKRHELARGKPGEVLQLLRLSDAVYTFSAR
jgi:hypothetical protein